MNARIVLCLVTLLFAGPVLAQAKGPPVRGQLLLPEMAGLADKAVALAKAPMRASPATASISTGEERVTSAVAIPAARPKATTTTWPAALSMTFGGFRSRWQTPRSCAKGPRA